jgi:thiol:disulfide interchange protein DsbD
MIKKLLKNFLILFIIISLGYSKTNNPFESTIFNNTAVQQTKIKKEDFIKLSVISQTSKEIRLKFDISKGIYLYKNRIKATIADNNVSKDIKLPATSLEKYNEPVYTNGLSLDIPINNHTNGNMLKIQYQYCGETTCYLPSIKIIKLTNIPQTVNWLQYLSLLSFLGIGILLAFTPCVLPMLPIVSSLIIGHTSKKKSLLLVICYILGMASVYVLIGILITKIGIAFQIYLQQKIFIFAFMIIFILLSLSLFGLLNFQLPTGANTKIYAIQNKIKQSSYFGSFIVGGLSSLILSPCTSAPLIGVLTTVANTGDLVYGSLALFLLAIGMGIPLLFFSVGLKQFVPKAGLWMIEIKKIFAFLMLGMAVYLGSRVINENIVIGLYTALSLGYIFYFLRYSIFATKLNNIIKSIVAFISIVISIFTFYSLSTQQYSHDNIHSVNSIANLDNKTNSLLKNNDYVLLDFYAKWCVECSTLAKNVLEKESFKDFLKSKPIKLVQVDLSEYNDKTSALADKYNVKGLPAMILIDKNKNESLRQAGLISEKELKEQIDNNI